MLSARAASDLLDQLARELSAMVNDPELAPVVVHGEVTIRLDARRERKVVKSKRWWATVPGVEGEIDLGESTYAAAAFASAHSLGMHAAVFLDPPAEPEDGIDQVTFRGYAPRPNLRPV